MTEAIKSPREEHQLQFTREYSYISRLKQGHLFFIPECETFAQFLTNPQK